MRKKWNPKMAAVWGALVGMVYVGVTLGASGDAAQGVGQMVGGAIGGGAIGFLAAVVRNRVAR